MKVSYFACRPEQTQALLPCQVMVSRRWDQIAADLRAAITQGRLQPGDRLPSCADLMASYGVSRATVQRAVDALRVEGLITTFCGRGWWVRNPSDVLRLVRSSQSHAKSQFPSATTNGWKPDAVDTVARIEFASAALSVELGVTEGSEVLVNDSDVYLRGRVIQLCSSHFPHPVLTPKAVELLVLSAILGTRDLLESAELQVSLISERVSASPSTQDEACRLGISRGCTVLRISRKVEGHGQCLQISHIAMASDQIELCYNLLGR
jgi:DNA-binding GntR family transcriptional regulator